MLARRVITVGLCLSALSACQLERLFPDKVGAGAARLSVRNAVKIMSLIDEDSTCGMKSPSVVQGFRQEGELGQPGSVTWTVEACALDFGSQLVAVGSDCNDSETTVRGRLTVSATRTVKGLLTGNPEQPVIPLSSDAVTYRIQADVEDYEIRLSDKVSGLIVQKGHIEIVSSIHLAQSASQGVCAVSTNDVTLNSVKYQDAVFTLDDGERVFDVEVPSLELEAQLGVYGDFENYVDGTITVWDTPVSLSSDQVLDPDYQADFFRDSFACKADLVLPVTYQCVPLTAKLAEGAAKLTVNNVGNLIEAMVANASCGFASPGVIDTAQVVGEIGKEGGEVVYRIDAPCSMDLPVKTAVGRDCLGKTTFAEGKASVTGTMILRGRRSGDPAQPIIPTSRDPVELNFNIAFDRWQVSSDASDKSLEVTGSLSGRMKPRMAIDDVTGACSLGTPVVTFEQLAYKTGTTGIVRSGGNALAVAIDGSLLNAQNGNKDGRENVLEGSLTVDGDVYQIPLSGAPVLDPDYNVADFAAGFACKPNLTVPTSEEQCNFHQVIGDGAARLIIQTVGTLASMVNGDATCGFEDKLGVLLWPSETIGDAGEMGSMTWDVEACTVGSEPLARQSEDCIGGATFQQGHADIDATRTVDGERTTELLFIAAIEPRDSSSVHIWLNEARLSEFVVYSLAAGESAPVGKLTIHDGTLSGLVEPATGARADASNTFDIATPIARISNVHLRNASVTLEAQGKVFEIFIADTQLDALNGSIGGESNLIAGTIMIDGDSVGVGGGLNPTFNQQTFESSYLCTENLAGPVH